LSAAVGAAAHVRFARAAVRRDLLGVSALTLAVTLAAGSAAGRAALLWAVATWCAVLVLAYAGLAALDREGHGLGLDNALTLGRALLAPAVGVSLARGGSGLALAGLALAALASDVADGRVARRLGSSLLGRLADPVADGLFFSAAAVACAQAGVLPPWVAAMVAARYGLPVLAGAAVFLARPAPLHVGHTVWGQASTAVIGLLLVAAASVQPSSGAVWLAALAAMAAVLAVLAVAGAAWTGTRGSEGGKG
jgi:cardiolipin synthase